MYQAHTHHLLTYNLTASTVSLDFMVLNMLNFQTCFELKDYETIYSIMVGCTIFLNINLT